ESIVCREIGKALPGLAVRIVEEPVVRSRNVVRKQARVADQTRTEQVDHRARITAYCLVLPARYLFHLLEKYSADPEGHQDVEAVIPDDVLAAFVVMIVPRPVRRADQVAF